MRALSKGEWKVAAHGMEHGKVLCFLRYVRDGEGWKKVSTEAANAVLKQHHSRRAKKTGLVTSLCFKITRY
jgi:hypothetical protein